MEKFRFITKNKTPYQKLRFGTRPVQYRASLWYWVSQLPKSPGVYTFKDNKSFLYIGKAGNIKTRVENHFKQPAYRENLFLDKIKKIGYIKTDSEIEALLLEAKLIKKYQPKFNIVWRDDKNYFYVAITKENLPRVLITHQPKIESRILNLELRRKNSKFQIPDSRFQYIGPFVEGASLKRVLWILRKIFPYYSAKTHPRNPCSWCHLGLCPGPKPDLKEYKKNIENLIAVLKGGRKSVLKNLKKEMKNVSKNQDFEKAAKFRDKILALEKIIAHAKVIKRPKDLKYNWEETQKVLQKIIGKRGKIPRIEAYDISNIQGQQATGAAVTFTKGLPDKNFYRKFKVKISGKPNDIAMIKEVLRRRFRHPEWPYPDLILIDGGIGQLSAALKIKKEQVPPAGEQNAKIKKKIKVLSLAKKRNELFIEGRKKPILLKKFPREIFNLILQLRDEAHRFARAYHHKLRKIDLLPKP